MNIANQTDCSEKACINIHNFKDDAVFDVLYKKYWDTLLNAARRYVADRQACQEIVQELFITLHVKRNHLSIKASLSSYLFRSLRNKIINHLRNESVYKKHIHILGQVHTTRTTGNEAELLMDATDLERQIIDCLNKMPVKYREVYLLVINDANPVKATAGILHRPVGTVERQLRIALRLLQEHLSKYKAQLQ